MNATKLKAKLCRKYKYRIELHAHTSPASGCSEIKPQELIETYKNLGYDAITLTNHFIFSKDFSKEEYVDRFLKDFNETKMYGDKSGIKVYLGAEIRFTENSNDYLIFGVDRKMLLDIYGLLEFGIENFRKNYAMPNSVFVQAHPFRNDMEKVSPELLDGIEVFNLHPSHNSRVGLASLYAKDENFPIITAGTDYHHKNCNHEGLTALLSSTLPDDGPDLAKILKSGDYLLEIGRNNIVIP